MPRVQQALLHHGDGSCRYNPIKTTKTSFLGTMNILGLAKRTKAKILLASTSEVYGDPLVHPQPETYWGNVNCIGERSCYDEGASGCAPSQCAAVHLRLGAARTFKCGTEWLAPWRLRSELRRKLNAAVRD
jgi:nucleoside-diphosphate-sugar epimerase